MNILEVSYPVHDKGPNIVSVREALKDIKSGETLGDWQNNNNNIWCLLYIIIALTGSKIFVGGSASSPTPLLVGLHVEAERRDLREYGRWVSTTDVIINCSISLHHIHLHGPSPWSAEGSSGEEKHEQSSRKLH